MPLPGKFVFTYMGEQFKHAKQETPPLESKDYRVMTPPPCATDAEILEGCEAGVFDWKFSETAELGTALDQLSPAAREVRGVAALLLQQGRAGEGRDSGGEYAARKEYQRLADAFKEDSERQILYLSERLQRLVDQGLIDSEERDTCLKDKVSPRTRALLWGLSPEDAKAFGKLAAMSKGELASGDRLRRLQTLQSELSARRGFPAEPAARLDELVAHYDELGQSEQLERIALINLRHVFRSADGLEVQLALHDFPLERLTRYIYLSTKEEAAMLAADSVARSIGPLTNDAVARIQSRVDAVYERGKRNPSEEKEWQMLLAEIKREPLLRDLQHPGRWKDMLLYGGLSR